MPQQPPGPSSSSSSFSSSCTIAFCRCIFGLVFFSDTCGVLCKGFAASLCATCPFGFSRAWRLATPACSAALPPFHRLMRSPTWSFTENDWPCQCVLGESNDLLLLGIVKASSSTPMTPVKPSSYSPSYPPLPAGKSSPKLEGAILAAETTRVLPPPIRNTATPQHAKATKFKTPKTVLDVVVLLLLCRVFIVNVMKCVRLSSD